MIRNKFALSMSSMPWLKPLFYRHSIYTTLNSPYPPSIISPFILNKEEFSCMVPGKTIEFPRRRNVVGGYGCLDYSCCKNPVQGILQGKNVAYVGGFGGIGFACCKELMKRTIQNLVILDIKDCYEKRKELRNVNPKVKSVTYVPLNLCNGKKAVEAALQETAHLIDPIDILINGAGVLMEQNPKQTIDVNVMGPIETTLAAIPLMRRDVPGRKGNGMIVNIACVLGLVPGGFAAVYTASKHAIVGFTRACAHEHYKKITGISHMAICPGIVFNTMTSNLDEAGTFEYSRPLSEAFQGAATQTAEDSAKPMVDAIENGKNGSIFIVDLGKKVEVGIPLYWQPSFDKNC